MKEPDQRFSEKVLAWFEEHGRKTLPWQQDINPYRVWVSEIMLQQTQVSTVISYYEKFMQSFSDIQSLAQASEDQVLAHWSGLGYYARGRNLLKAAKMVKDEFDGQMPDDLEQLQTLPGIGRSTAGAILSLASGQQQAILDGNVKRVLARCYAVEGWPGRTDVLKTLWSLSEALTPMNQTAQYNQAMMDIGATLCKRRNPECHRCPVQDLCVAYKEDRAHDFPASKPKKNLPVKEAAMLVLVNDEGQVLLTKRPPTGIWGGLWALPQLENPSEYNEWCHNNGLEPDRLQEPFLSFKHTFTHFHLQIEAYSLKTRVVNNTVLDDEARFWYKGGSEFGGMPTPVKKILNKFWESEHNGKNG